MAVVEGPSTATGLRLRVQRVAAVPVVAIRISLPGGARREALPGCSLVTGRLLSEGTAQRDHQQLAERVEARGMLLHTGGSFESHGLSLDALAADWEEALDLAAELIFEPAFAAERTAWVARQATAELESLGDQPEVRTAWGFLEQLYTPHPRSRPLHGTAADLAALTPADCAAFHLAGLARGATVVVTGDLDEAAVTARVECLFADLGDIGIPNPARDAEPPPARGLDERRRVVSLPAAEAEEAAQGHLYAGHLTVPRTDPDYEALVLAGVVLGAGSGLTGRIPERIREREGLAYTASAHTVSGAGLDPGRLVIYVGTSAATLSRAEAAAREELERFVADGPSDEEFADARAYLVGREPFRRETARQLADLTLSAEHYGLPLDQPGWRETQLLRLTPDDVHAAIRRHLRKDWLAVTEGVPGFISSARLN